MPAIRSPSLKVRTPASQAGNDGFKSRRSYCGYRTVAVKRTQFALQICGSAYGGSIPLVTLWMGMPSGEGSGL